MYVPAGVHPMGGQHPMMVPAGQGNMHAGQTGQYMQCVPWGGMPQGQPMPGQTQMDPKMQEHVQQQMQLAQQQYIARQQGGKQGPP